MVRTLLASGRQAAANHTDAAAAAASSSTVFTGRRRAFANWPGAWTKCHNRSGACTGAKRSANSNSSHSDMPVPPICQVRKPPLERLVRAIQARCHGSLRTPKHHRDFLIR
jgi:hypothetical protein